MSGLYIYPNVGRAGLGNVMLPWARAEVFRRKHSLPMLAPQWTQPKIGPLLRGESDLRYYTGLFRQEGYVRGLRKLWLLRTAQRVPEADAAEFIKNTPSPNKTTLIEFEGLGNFFEPLLPHQDYLKERINQIISPAVQAEVDQEPIDFEIACHIRRGDMQTVEYGTAVTEATSCQALPLAWFAAVIQSLRQALGEELPVCIFSDGSDLQLQECLSLPKVRRAHPKSSIADILTMAKAPLLVTTATSTFSQWAAFLGQMPSFWYPSLTRNLSVDSECLEIEADLYGVVAKDHSDLINQALVN